MFKEFKSKEIIRHAYKVAKGDTINSVLGQDATFVIFSIEHKENVIFKAYEEVKEGDYIVRLTKEDTYHCNAVVFAERNVIDQGEENGQPAS